MKVANTAGNKEHIAKKRRRNCSMSGFGPPTCHQKNYWISHIPQISVLLLVLSDTAVHPARVGGGQGRTVFDTS